VTSLQEGGLFLFIFGVVVESDPVTTVDIELASELTDPESNWKPYSLMHTARVDTTLPVLSAAIYPCCTSSVKNNIPAPRLPVAAAYLTAFR
jgi:hypothetical protein